MELKIIQAQCGRFNIIGDEYQVSLSIGIYDGDKLLNVDGEDVYIKIFKDVSSKEEGEYLVDMFNLAFNEFRIHEIFKQSFKDNYRDYNFYKIFMENIDEIYNNHKYEHKEDKEIVKQKMRDLL